MGCFGDDLASAGSALRMRNGGSGIFRRWARARRAVAVAFRAGGLTADAANRTAGLRLLVFEAARCPAVPRAMRLTVPVCESSLDAERLPAFLRVLSRFFRAAATAALAARAAFLARFASLRATLTLAFACRARFLARPACAVAAFSSNSARYVASARFDDRDWVGCFFMVRETGKNGD